MSQVDACSAYSCATLRFLVDGKRDVSLPVAVVIWSMELNRLWFRQPEPGERIDGVSVATVLPYLKMVKSQIEGWHRDGALPYAKTSLVPLSPDWWEGVRALMQWSVRLGPGQPIDCVRPEEEIEALYEALVKPKTSDTQRKLRVDGVVTRALGPLSGKFEARRKAPGFHSRPVPVLRLASDDQHAVIVEAVNLAATDAEKEADALTSRLRRIKASDTRLAFRFVLGYLSSPNGLNGERSLKEWIEKEVESRIYDLTTEEDSFREAASRALADIGDALGVYEGAIPAERSVSPAILSR
jgi:hypothetical protein